MLHNHATGPTARIELIQVLETSILRRRQLAGAGRRVAAAGAGRRRDVAGDLGAGGRRLKRDPAVAGEVGLDPGMRVEVSVQVAIRILIVPGRIEPYDLPSWDTEDAQHFDHRRGVVGAVPLFAVEQ